MEFFDVIRARRSVRKYTAKPVPEEVIEKALDAALLAPNSSNMQTWEFYWVRTPEKKAKLVEACLNQNAARNARELVVIVAAPKLWKKNNEEMIRRAKAQGLKPIVLRYYEKLMPFEYTYHWLAPIKWLILNWRGLFKPTARHPWSFRDVQEISLKSAALAAENFMLAVVAQGFATCPMEGFDERRVKRLLGLRYSDKIVMVVSVGEMDPKGMWGPQVRFPREWYVHRV